MRIHGKTEKNIYIYLYLFIFLISEVNVLP